MVRSTVAPSSRRPEISRQTSRRLSGSRPVVGSSRTPSSGRPISALASSTRRVAPPDSASIRTSARAWSDSSASMSSTGRGEVRVACHWRSVSRTVRSPEKPLRWSRIPVRRRSRARSAIGWSPSTLTSPWLAEARPSTLTVPAVAGASPSSTSRVEVFPAPLVPSSAVTEPVGTSRSTPRTAS